MYGGVHPIGGSRGGRPTPWGRLEPISQLGRISYGKEYGEAKDKRLDSSEGISKLSKGYIIGTQSDGNISLPKDLKRHGNLPFKLIPSAEHFRAYKPSLKVYNETAEALALNTDERTLAAAHSGDPEAAKSCGYRTIYVGRPLEEIWSVEQTEKAKEEG
ncbi:hypothetical protein FGG08_004742 [Glutinoglossum americanum]|uniref:Uncharacterized protein n=1 Tax=Glutinoglossum americanum TaxID=1670608 RepID=A0A9P8L2E8_9PEZI|nr:hypothetical protein FGG08_004742 [Glutinoglossum americanum]